MKKHILIGIILTAILSYTTLIHNYKYTIPWTGLNDFRHYHDMVLAPLSFEDVPAPFSMRRLTPIIARGILETGLIPPLDIWFAQHATFSGQTYSQDVLWALMLANWLGLLATGALVYAAIAHQADKVPRAASNPVDGPAVLAVALLLLCGNTTFYIIAPLVEGWTLFLVTAIFLLLHRDDALGWLAIPLVFIGMLQRELVVVATGAYALAEIVVPPVFGRPLAPARRRFLLAVLAGALVAAALYLVARGALPATAPRYAHQTSIAAWIGSVRRLGALLGKGETFRVMFFKLNLLLMWGMGITWAWRRHLDTEARIRVITLMLPLAVLCVITVLTRSTSPDRVMMILSPMIAISLAHIITGGRGGIPPSKAIG